MGALKKLKNLKPCPCCGSIEVRAFQGHHPDHTPFWQVFCRNCQLRTEPNLKKADALATWNTRPESANEPATAIGVKC